MRTFVKLRTPVKITQHAFMTNLKNFIFVSATVASKERTAQNLMVIFYSGGGHQ